MSKSLKPNDGHFTVPATLSGSKPGNFELGSPESRAAARALIDGQANYNPVPIGLSEEELNAWLRTQPDEVLEQIIACDRARRIADVGRMQEKKRRGTAR